MRIHRVQPPTITPVLFEWNNHRHDLYSNTNLIEGELPAPVLFLPGLGHGEIIIPEALKTLASVGVHAFMPHMDYRQMDPTQLEIERMCREFPNAIAAMMIEQFSLANKKVQAGGLSEGGGAISLALDENPDHFSDIGLVMPAGSNFNEYKHASNRLRQLQLYKRALLWSLSLARPSMHDASILRSSVEVNAAILQDMRSGYFTQKLDTALALNIVPALIKHAVKGNRVFITLSAKDRLYPADEVQNQLTQEAASMNISLRNVPTLTTMEYPDIPHGALNFKFMRPVVNDLAIFFNGSEKSGR